MIFNVIVFYRASFVHPSVDELLFCMLVHAGEQEENSMMSAKGNRRTEGIEG